jgi:hypothetical protein
MAHMSSTKVKPLHYFISYGFTGGPGHGRSLRRLLEQAGFQLAPAIDHADIVIGHSAGCWAITNDLPAKLIVLVGMPLQNGQRLKTFRKVRKAAGQRHPLLRAKYSLLSVFYGLAAPRRNLAIIKQAASLVTPLTLKHEQVVFVVNQHDQWLDAQILRQQFQKLPFSFIGLTGTHDDIFYHPEHYVDIITYYAKRFLATSER